MRLKCGVTCLKMVKPMKGKFMKYSESILPIINCVAVLNMTINVGWVDYNISYSNDLGLLEKY